MDIIEDRILIRATPVQIMPYLVEPHLLEAWSPTEVIVKLLSKKKTGPGTKLRMEFVGHGMDPITYEIVEQTETLLIGSIEGRMNGEDRWTLTPKGKTTEVHNRMEFHAPDMLTLMAWKAVGRAIAVRDVREKMPLLRDLVEQAVLGK
ncbi:MAG: SRPBCC family protein [Blastocatellia bacterium]|nr:SRPBCC family protein [Blastocatellia bacterium]